MLTLKETRGGEPHEISSAMLEKLMAPWFYSLIKTLKEKLRSESTLQQRADSTN